MVRDDVLAAGITINGLPIMGKREPFTMDIENLDIYWDCVIGGPARSSSIQIAISSRRDPHQARARSGGPDAGAPRGADQARQPPVSCTIGEQMWRDRWGIDFCVLCSMPAANSVEPAACGEAPSPQRVTTLEPSDQFHMPGNWSLASRVRR
jgi:hypothetical protein